MYSAFNRTSVNVHYTGTTFEIQHCLIMVIKVNETCLNVADIKDGPLE